MSSRSRATFCFVGGSTAAPWRPTAPPGYDAAQARPTRELAGRHQPPLPRRHAPPGRGHRLPCRVLVPLASGAHPRGDRRVHDGVLDPLELGGRGRAGGVRGAARPRARARPPADLAHDPSGRLCVGSDPCGPGRGPLREAGPAAKAQGATAEQSRAHRVAAMVRGLLQRVPMGVKDAVSSLGRPAVVTGLPISPRFDAASFWLCYRAVGTPLSWP